MADENGEIQRALGRIEGKLDSIQSAVSAQGGRLDAAWARWSRRVAAASRCRAWCAARRTRAGCARSWRRR